MIPETRYAKASDGTYLAYQVFGEGDQDLLWVPGGATHLEVFWEHPPAARFLRRLATFARVIWFDKRGTGLSDRVSRLPGLETMMDDAGVVLDTADCERAILFGEGGDGGGVCALFAASFPQRSTALIWWDATPRSAWGTRLPVGHHRRGVCSVRSLHGGGLGIQPRRGRGRSAIRRCVDRRRPRGQAMVGEAPPICGDPSRRRGARPHVVRDGRAEHPSGHPRPHADRRQPTARGLREHSQLDPGCGAAEVPSPDRPPWRGDQDALFSVLGRFLDSVRDERMAFDRVLATVLFTDIVSSADKASSLGDRAWKELLEKHHALVRGLLARFGGREVDTAGDGFFATFDGPARAIRCATAIADSVKRLGVEVRTGVHAGEIETIAGKAGGIAVMIGARIGAMAEPSEVLVSGTVKDLVAGSGLSFEPRGEYELKGVPDHWAALPGPERTVGPDLS